jgi:hypothetical protein
MTLEIPANQTSMIDEGKEFQLDLKKFIIMYLYVFFQCSNLSSLAVLYLIVVRYGSDIIYFILDP